MPAALFNGTAVKLLKDILKFKSGTLIITNQSADPSVTATNAPQGSVYIQNMASGGVYIKQDAGNTTNWLKIATTTDLTAYALRNLSNLSSPTAINQTLQPASNGGASLGANGFAWSFGFIGTIRGSNANTDAIGVNSRILNNTAGNTMLDFSTAGTLDASSNKISNMLDPLSAQDGATKNYVDNLVSGLSWKTAARAASVANVNIASVPASIDGVTLNNNDRILLKDQSTASENGIYIFHGTGSALTRSTDMNTWNEVVGSVLLITEGSVNIGSKWVNTNIAGGTLGTTSITFIAFSIAGTVNGTGTTNTIAYWTGVSNLGSSTTTITELNYLSGTTSSVQTQLNNKASTDLSNLTPTAINVSLLPGTNGTLNLGNATFGWNKLTANSIVNQTGNTILDIVNGYGIDGASRTSIDFFNRQLQRFSGSPIVMWDWSGTNLSANSHKITNVTDPTLAQDVATKNYVDTNTSNKANTSLSNLISTAFNVDIVPNADNTLNIGSSSDKIRNIYIANTIQGPNGSVLDMVSGTLADPVAENKYIDLANGRIFDESQATAYDWQNGTLHSGGVLKIDFSGTDVDFNTRKLISVVDPTNPQDAATKNYVDTNLINQFKFFASSQVTTSSTVLTSSSFATFSNSPAFTFTPTVTGTYKVYSAPPIEADQNSVNTVRIFATSGSPTLLYESQGISYGNDSAGANTSISNAFSQSVYTLTSGTSYTFDIQGKTNNTSALRGDVAAFYMFAELCG